MWLWAMVTVHEWGTFTSVAGPDGQAIEWLALTDSTNLPGFVEHFREEGFKCRLGGTVRMETPVMYFYSPLETSVSVKVSFAKGFITEWYPHASGVEPAVVRPGMHPDGSIRWDNVRLLPGSTAAFPSSDDGNQYFAARSTGSTPLRVNAGRDEDEKFLFYRGVASAALPIAATITADAKVLVRNLGAYALPAVMRIESRDGKLGYRLACGVSDQALLDSPALTASRDSMLEDLERALVAQGLYMDEARAMIATWRNSWFEEGSRLLYMLPASAVNNILPLTVNPTPAQTVRVFVGRLELVTPATDQAVSRAVAAHDKEALGKYRRFLEPILKSMLNRTAAGGAEAKSLNAALGEAYAYACSARYADER